jgi:hypothetical protein
MKDKRKIILGSKDVFPFKDNDLFLNVELSRTSNELINEIVDNNFNILEQFENERQNSLKFCFYGIVESPISDTTNLELSIETNQEDIFYIPRNQTNSLNVKKQIIKTQDLSKSSTLSKNIFENKKSSYFFICELSPFFNNSGTTKDLVITINDKNKKLYAKINVPFLYFDSEGNRMPFGNDTIDIDLQGNQQIVKNDFPFLYDTHWVRTDLNIATPSTVSFVKSIIDDSNFYSVKENISKVNFNVKLNRPSVYGIEELEVFIKTDNTIKNPNNDYYFLPKKLKFNIGEQYKSLSVNILNDKFVEKDENLIFGFRDVKSMEEGKNNFFNLNIVDEDKPVLVKFETSFQSVIESETVLNIKLSTDKLLNVPNQYVEVIVDDLLTTAICGVDFENIGIPSNPLYKKKINLPEETYEASFTIKLYDSNNYDKTKNIVLRLSNPSQNILIDNSNSTHTIEIKGSIITQYTKYTIPSDGNKGYGIFRMSNPIVSDTNAKLNFLNSPNFPSSFSTDFTYSIKVINKGVPIVYNNDKIYSEEIVVDIDMNHGFQELSLYLPSNYEFDSQNKVYKKSKYQFIIYNIKPLGITSSIFNSLSLGNSNNSTLSNKMKNFSPVNVQVDELESSLIKDEIEYFMVSKIKNIKTRLDYNGQNYICGNSISNDVVTVEINGSILLSEFFTEHSANDGGTSLYKTKFQKDLIIYNDCLNSQNNSMLIPVKISTSSNF